MKAPASVPTVRPEVRHPLSLLPPAPAVLVPVVLAPAVLVPAVLVPVVIVPMVLAVLVPAVPVPAVLVPVVSPTCLVKIVRAKKVHPANPAFRTDPAMRVPVVVPVRLQ